MQAAVRLDDSQVRRHTGLVSQPETDRLSVRCGGMSRPQWFCAQTHPSAERWALNNLRQSGYTAYLPMCTVLARDRVIRSLMRERITPLFAGYLFLQLGQGEPWTPVYHSPGIARLLGSGRSKPEIVPDALIDALQAGEAARATLTPPDAPGRCRWLPGAAVRLCGGAFDGRDAVVLSVARETAVVGLVVFGAMREAIVGLSLLASRDAS